MTSNSGKGVSKFRAVCLTRPEYTFRSEAIDYSDMQLIVIHLLGLFCQATLFFYGLFHAVKGTLSSKRMGIVIAAYFCVICITSTSNYSKITAWQIAAVEAARIIPYVLGAIASVFYYICNNNSKLYLGMIYAVSSWGIFQILISNLQLFLRNGQYLSMNTTVNLVLKIAIFGLILYQTSTLRTKRKKALAINEIEKV